MSSIWETTPRVRSVILWIYNYINSVVIYLRHGLVAFKISSTHYSYKSLLITNAKLHELHARFFSPLFWIGFDQQGRSQTFFGSTHKVRLILRDGPLEKLLRCWGGGGIFELHEFFVNISLVGIYIFSVCRKFFSGLLVVYEFFHSIFRCMNFFVLCSPPSPP